MIFLLPLMCDHESKATKYLPKTNLMKMKRHKKHTHIRDVTISISNCQYLRRFSIVDMMVVYLNKNKRARNILPCREVCVYSFLHHRKILLALFSNAINFLKTLWQMTQKHLFAHWFYYHKYLTMSFRIGLFTEGHKSKPFSFQFPSHNFNQIK